MKAILLSLLLGLSVLFPVTANAGDVGRPEQSVYDEVMKAKGDNPTFHAKIIKMDDNEVHLFVAHFSSDPNQIDYNSGMLLVIEGDPMVHLALSKDGIIVFEGSIPTELYYKEMGDI